MLKLLLLLTTILCVSCTHDDKKPVEPIQPPIVEAPPIENFLEIVYFEFDDHSLTNESMRSLNVLSDYLKKNPELIILVEGHCDERGSIEYNLALGQRRAASVLAYLITLGIDKNNLVTVSMGEETPAMIEHNEAAWARNRRVEFKYTN
jgi:peptidoglycan-associated lipoprotein